ncbi:MAG TPA: HAMP domain-containing sensor histidine kinase [Trebonia sp.]
MRAISSSLGRAASPPGGGESGARFLPRVPHLAARSLALRWPYSPALLDYGWAVFSALNLVAIFWFANWETIPFHFIWISLTVLYGFQTWRTAPTLWVLGTVMVTTTAGIGLDVWRGSEPPEELTEVPLMAAVFLAMAWHAHRRQTADQSTRLLSEQNVRLLATQRQFLQDAAHQLRTPITIALGHAELLADDLTGHQEGQDIQVVIGELSRLRRIAERLLLIASAADPGFLHAEAIALDRLTMELIRRWRPAADRRWQLGRLDAVTVRADRERLALALDALLENAVRHTETNDVIQLSVIRGWPGMPVRIIVADTGSGIPGDQLHLIFDRFRTGDDKSRGTGLGLPLVRAVARAHGGDVTVHSKPGLGSEFELTLPQAASGRPQLAGSAVTGLAEHEEPGAQTASGGPAATDASSAAAGNGQQQKGTSR